MEPIRWTMLRLWVGSALVGVCHLGAHEGHIPVMGTVTRLTDGHRAVQTTGGQTVTVQLDHHTPYRADGMATSSMTIRIGDRVVVEVTEEANGLRAVEVRYAPVAPATP